MQPYVVRRLRPELAITVGAMTALVAIAVLALDFSPLLLVVVAAVAGVNLWLGSVVLRIDRNGIGYAQGRRIRRIPWEAVKKVTTAGDAVVVHTRHGKATIPVRGLDHGAVTEAVRLNRG